MKSFLVWSMLFCLFAPSLRAQKSDTLHIAMDEAEQLFIKNNFTLLAQKYAVESAKAAILQAKLLPNPTVNLEQTLITRATVANDANIGSLGQHAFQLQQLIQLAGKRNKQIQMAQLNANITEYQFVDLVRTLSFQLRSSFYNVYFLSKTLATYEAEIGTLNKLISAYRLQIQKGNIPEKELIRLQSFLVTLETERSDIAMQIADNEAMLKTLLADTSTKTIAPVVNESVLADKDLDDIRLGELSSMASENRYDRKIQEASVQLASANVQLQKALATPDLTLGYSYDRAGNYVNNYHALTLSMALPVFNKNQGNIKAAASLVQANQQYLAQTDTQIGNEVLQALVKAKEAERLYRSMDKDYLPNFDKLIKGVIDNYLKRNITLLEFMDFLESYKNTVAQINTLQNSRMQTFENLNFTVGKKVL